MKTQDTKHNNWRRANWTIALSLAVAFNFIGTKTQAADLLIEVSRIRQLQEAIYLRIDSVTTTDVELNNEIPAEPLHKFKIIPGQSSESLVVENLNPGLYVAWLFQDTNNNAELDMDKKGRPTEPYGLSNNPVLLKAPVLKDAVFEIADDDTTIKIRLRNTRRRSQ